MTAETQRTPGNQNENRYKFSCSGRGLYPSLNTSDHVTIPTFGISDRIAHKGICNPPNTILGKGTPTMQLLLLLLLGDGPI